MLTPIPRNRRISILFGERLRSDHIWMRLLYGLGQAGQQAWLVGAGKRSQPEGREAEAVVQVSKQHFGAAVLKMDARYRPLTIRVEK